MAGKCWFAGLADQTNRLFRPKSFEKGNAGQCREAAPALLSGFTREQWRQYSGLEPSAGVGNPPARLSGIGAETRCMG